MRLTNMLVQCKVARNGQTQWFSTRPPLQFITMKNCGLSFTKDILSSLHFSLLRWTLFCVDHSATLCAISREQFRLPLATTSDTVISSTYFRTLAKLSTYKSFISTRNGHGSKFFPEGPRRAIILTDRRKFTKPLPFLNSIITLTRVASSIVAKNSYKTTFVLVYFDYITQTHGSVFDWKIRQALSK